MLLEPMVSNRAARLSIRNRRGWNFMEDTDQVLAGPIYVAWYLLGLTTQRSRVGRGESEKTSPLVTDCLVHVNFMIVHSRSSSSKALPICLSFSKVQVTWLFFDFVGGTSQSVNLVKHIRAPSRRKCGNQSYQTATIRISTRAYSSDRRNDFS
jgi:hypothetical protein